MAAGSHSSSATDAPPRFAPPGAGGVLAGSAKLPLAFFGVAFLWLAVGAGGLAWHAPVLAAHYSQLTVVALAHAWLPGFLLGAAFGAVYQLFPVVLGAALVSERLAWWHFVLHTAGMLMLVPSFFLGRFEGVAGGGALAAAGVVLFAVNVIRTFLRAPHRDAVGWSFVLATGWLVLTVLSGAVMAANRRWGFLPLDVLALLRSHAHLGVAGFFLTLLQGAAFRLIPMFTMGEVRSWFRVRAGLWGTQAGLAVLAPALIWHWNAGITAGAGVLVLGMALSGWELAVMLGGRRKRLLDPGLQAFVGGAAAFGAAAGCGFVLALRPAADGGHGAWLAGIYGTLAVLGGLVPIMGGMLCKIVPFLVWMRVYGPRIGREPVLPPASLAKPEVERNWLLMHGCALVLLLTGVATGGEIWLAAGGWMLAAGIALFLFNQAWVLSHLWKK